MMMHKTMMVLGLTALLAGGGMAIGQAPPPGPPAPPDRGPQQGESERGNRGEQGKRAERGQRGEHAGRGDQGGRGRGGRWGGNPSQGLLGGPAGRLTRTLFRPDYMTRDLALIAESLALDEGQTDVVDMLLGDYDANFRMAVEETKQAMLDLGEASGADELEQERIESLRGEMRTMREEMRAAREAARSEPQRDESKESKQPEETDEQRETRRAEREAVREQFRERMSTIRDQFREVRMAQMESDVMQDLLSEHMTLLKQFQRIRAGMASEMNDALFAVLSEDQVGNWDRLSAHLRRIRQLPEGRLQGERTDLGPIIESVMAGLETQQADGVRELVMSWELDLDEALMARTSHDESTIFQMLEAMQEADYERILELMKRRQTRAEAVRDVTDASIEAIAAALPTQQGSDFRSAALQAGYDRVFRTSRSQRAITSATKLDELEEETLALIEALLVECNAAIAAENEDVLAVLRSHDEPREVRWVERMQRRASGEEVNRFDDEEDPVRDAFEARGELDEVYLDRLRDILGETRMAELPRGDRGARRGERGDRGQRGFGGDRDAMRQQFMQRFDANGDGEIDDAEREKIGEFFRQMREGGGEGGPPPFGGPPPHGDG